MNIQFHNETDFTYKEHFRKNITYKMQELDDKYSSLLKNAYYHINLKKDGDLYNVTIKITLKMMNEQIHASIENKNIDVAIKQAIYATDNQVKKIKTIFNKKNKNKAKFIKALTEEIRHEKEQQVHKKDFDHTIINESEFLAREKEEKLEDLENEANKKITLPK